MRVRIFTLSVSALIFIVLIIVLSIITINLKYISIIKNMKYYDNLPVPKFTSDEVINTMREEKGLYKTDTEMFKAVEYYVYHSNKRVIKQLIDNLQYEIEIQFPEDYNRISVYDYFKGKSYKILENESGLLRAISPVLHEELYKNASLNNNDKMLYLIIGYINANDKCVEKPDNDPDYSTPFTRSGRYYDIDFYTQEIVDHDIMALLTIYENYQNRPTIIKMVESYIAHYPGDWLVFEPNKPTMNDILKGVKEQGAEKTFEIYKSLERGAEKGFERYRSLTDFNTPVKQYKH